jgi:hypothetical protein
MRSGARKAHLVSAIRRVWAQPGTAKEHRRPLTVWFWGAEQIGRREE